MNSNILSSWKQIAAYTGFTERTLQRWERHYGFPVHRPARKARSAVSALTTEIDKWLSAAPSLPEIQQTLVRYPGRLRPQLTCKDDSIKEPSSPRFVFPPLPVTHILVNGLSSTFSMSSDMAELIARFRKSWQESAILQEKSKRLVRQTMAVIEQSRRLRERTESK